MWDEFFLEVNFESSFKLSENYTMSQLTTNFMLIFEFSRKYDAQFVYYTEQFISMLDRGTIKTFFSEELH